MSTAVLLRSTIVCDISDAPELLLQNLLALDKSGLVPEVREEVVIWEAVRTFARLHQHVPELPTVQAQLTDARDLSALDYLLQQVGRLPCKTRGDFAVLIDREVEVRRAADLLETLKQVRAVATTGLEEGRGRAARIRKGTDDALALLREQMRGLERSRSGEKISGEVTSDVREMSAEYDRAKTNPIVGNYCGLQQIDETLRGSKNRELWVHAAYSSHMKSTFALNWCYHLSVFFNSSVVFFSLEMNYEQVRRQIAAMHSFHFKFREVRRALGLQPSEKLDTGLDYEKIRDGLLSPKEEEFYKQHVLADLADQSRGYGKIHIEVKDPNQASYRVADVRDVAERKYQEDPFVKIFIDHTGLLEPREGSRHVTTTEKLNEVLKDVKSLARGFRNGAGTDITILHQINRAGLSSALKKKESGRAPRYDMTNLSQTSGAEQHADVVSTSWVDEDLRAKSLVLFDCLKSRDGAPFKPFYADVRWPCRRILTSTVPFTEVAADGTSAARRRRPAGPVGVEIFNALNGQGEPAAIGSPRGGN